MTEHLLTATIIHGEDIEAEPVTVVCEDNWVCLTLDDGKQVVLLRSELFAVITSDERAAA